MSFAGVQEVEDNLIYLDDHNDYSDQKLRRILRDVKTFALVGASLVSMQ